MVFSEAMATYEVWVLLEKLEERIPLRWIMPGDRPDLYVSYATLYVFTH